MNFKEYQNLAMISKSKEIEGKVQLANGVRGLNGEAGEVIDLVKKHLFHGHDLDVEKIKLELGDVLWYIAECADALDLDLEDIAKANIAKLKARYPEGFSFERSINRED